MPHTKVATEKKGSDAVTAAERNTPDVPDMAEQGAPSGSHPTLQSMTASALSAMQRDADTHATHPGNAQPPSAAERYNTSPEHRESMRKLIEENKLSLLTIKYDSDYDGTVAPVVTPPMSDEVLAFAMGMGADVPEQLAKDESRYHRDLLFWDAITYFKSTPIFISARSDAVTAVDSVAIDQETIAQPALVKALLKASNGLIFGENHKKNSGVAFVLDNLASFAAEGVDTLYFEHLYNDLYQSELDAWFDSPHAESHNNDMKGVGKCLAWLNNGHKKERAVKGYSYCDVVDEANAYSIRVVAIDCVASYSLKQIYGDDYAREKMMNFYAKHVIEAHQRATGNGKWIALVGESHTNAFGGVPGLADLTDGLGIRLAEGLENSATADPGENIAGFDVRATLLIKVRSALIRPLPKTDPQT